MAYMTDKERAEPLEHICNHFTFKSRMDLKGGVKLVPHGKAKKVPMEHVMSDVATFTAWWIRNIHPNLNGFSGIDTVKWEIEW